MSGSMCASVYDCWANPKQIPNCIISFYMYKYGNKEIIIIIIHFLDCWANRQDRP